MRFSIFATDFDNTLADEGVVVPETWAALDRLIASGRSAVLVTGRTVPDLLPHLDAVRRFRWIVAENGAEFPTRRLKCQGQKRA